MTRPIFHKDYVGDSAENRGNPLVDQAWADIAVEENKDM
jgi:hypothetical protein